MSVAQPSTSLCKSCGKAFGFPADFCAFCGAAQRQAGPASGAKPAQPQPAPSASKPAANPAAGQARDASAERAPAATDGVPGPVPASRPPVPVAEGSGEPSGLPPPRGGATVALAGMGAVAVIVVAVFLYRAAPPRVDVPPSPPPIRIEAHGHSRLLSFTQGERISWTYPPCAPPALPACVDLVAAGQERFALGGAQDVAQRRVTGHYTFHRAMTGQLRSGADTGVDVVVTLGVP